MARRDFPLICGFAVVVGDAVYECAGLSLWLSGSVVQRYTCCEFEMALCGWSSRVSRGPDPAVPYIHANSESFHINGACFDPLHRIFLEMSGERQERKKGFTNIPYTGFNDPDGLQASLTGVLEARGSACGLNFRLNEWQIDVAATFIEGKDQMVITATGSGKSLCFLLPLFLQPEKSLIIISPLLSLMANQVGP